MAEQASDIWADAGDGTVCEQVEEGEGAEAQRLPKRSATQQSAPVASDHAAWETWLSTTMLQAQVGVRGFHWSKESLLGAHDWAKRGAGRREDWEITTDRWQLTS